MTTLISYEMSRRDAGLVAAELAPYRDRGGVLARVYHVLYLAIASGAALPRIHLTPEMHTAAAVASGHMRRIVREADSNVRT